MHSYGIYDYPLLTAVLQAEEHPGFTDALLDILQAEQEGPVRLSSTHARRSQYLSNILTLNYSRCLPQEPSIKGMGTERGFPAE